MQVPARSKWQTPQSLHANSGDGHEAPGATMHNPAFTAATALAQAQTGTIERCRGVRMANGTHIRACMQTEEEALQLLSQLRADQMPGPPREGQLICTLFLSMRQ